MQRIAYLKPLDFVNSSRSLLEPSPLGSLTEKMPDHLREETKALAWQAGMLMWVTTWGYTETMKLRE
jgi:hypothetical protein